MLLYREKTLPNLAEGLQADSIVLKQLVFYEMPLNYQLIRPNIRWYNFGIRLNEVTA